MGWVLLGFVLLLLWARWRKRRLRSRRLDAGAAGDAVAGMMAPDVARGGIDRARKRSRLLGRYDYGTGL